MLIEPKTAIEPQSKRLCRWIIAGCITCRSRLSRSSSAATMAPCTMKYLENIWKHAVPLLQALQALQALVAELHWSMALAQLCLVCLVCRLVITNKQLRSQSRARENEQPRQGKDVVSEVREVIAICAYFLYFWPLMVKTTHCFTSESVIIRQANRRVSDDL